MARVTSIQLKSFRCFDNNSMHFDAPFVLIQGNNGSGKSSFLEALHYGCYLRSFRTHNSRDLLKIGSSTFFIKIFLEDETHDSHEIQIGFSGAKKMVKINQTLVKSYKDLIQLYRAISLTDEDLFLIRGEPEIRRTFIDQAIILEQPDYADLLRKLRVIIQQRNALIKQKNTNNESFSVWTEQLWKQSHIVTEYRLSFLEKIASITNRLLKNFFSEATVTCSYRSTLEYSATLQDFLQKKNSLQSREIIMGRSLFGAHLDDILFSFQGKLSRIFASRGQQKLIVVLLKIAQLELITHRFGPSLLLLDDFMSDFDNEIGIKLLDLITKLQGNIIITSPTHEGIFEQEFMRLGAQFIQI